MNGHPFSFIEHFDFIIFDFVGFMEKEQIKNPVGSFC